MNKKLEKLHKKDEAVHKKLHKVSEKEEHLHKKEEKLHKAAEKAEKPKPKESSKAKAKVKRVMKEFKYGELHSGSKKGPKVTNPKQAVAIGLSEARKAGAKIPKKK